MSQTKLGAKLINNSYLGVYKIFKVLEQLKYTSYKEVKDKKDISKFIYSLYDDLKKEFKVNNDADLQDELNNNPNIGDNVKTILNAYFDSALGVRTDIKNGDLLDSVFIDVICKGFEFKSHLHYKFAGIFTYQDFELPKMEPQKFIDILTNNLKPIYINKEEVDKRLSTQFGLDDKVDNIRLLKKYSKISQLGFVLNTCHNYSPGQHWVAMCMQLLQSSNDSNKSKNSQKQNSQKQKHFRLFYYDSQMTPLQQNGIGFQTEPLDCEYYPECPTQYRHYTPKVKEWLQKLSNVLTQNNITYTKSSTNVDDANSNLIKVHFNKQNTQGDDYSCGYHSVLFNYLMAVNGEALDTIQSRLKTKSNLDSIISQFRKLLVRTTNQDEQTNNSNDVNTSNNVDIPNDTNTSNNDNSTSNNNDNTTSNEYDQQIQEGGVRQQTKKLMQVYL